MIDKNSKFKDHSSLKICRELYWDTRHLLLKFRSYLKATSTAIYISKSAFKGCPKLPATSVLVAVKNIFN